MPRRAKERGDGGRCWRWFAVAALLLFAVGGWGFSQAGKFLAATASAPVRADLGVVLGGDSGLRAARALSLVQEGYVDRLLLTGFAYLLEDERPASSSWRVRRLLAAGIARDALEFDRESRNSFEEARNTFARMEQAGWTTALVVTDPPHARRVQWVWGRVFDNTGRSFRIVTTQPEWWNAARWWNDERSGAAVIMEYIKLAYYLVQH